MLREKKFPLRTFAILLLAASLFSAAMRSNARAAYWAAADTQINAFAASNTPRPTKSLTPTDTTVPTDTFTPTLSPTITPSQTTTPSAPAHIVISEFRTLGPLGAGDEFVELYNPTGAAVNIGLWYIGRSSSCASSLATFITIPSGTFLQPGQHYLMASTSSNISSADQTFSPGIADDGGLALISSSEDIIDQVGMCTSTYYREGTILAPLSGNSDQSYERKPGGDTSCYDTDNNEGDFAWRSPANPQNSESAAVLCSGVNLDTPTNTPTLTPSPTVPTVPTDTFTPTVSLTIAPSQTSTPSAPAHIVISEFRTLGPLGAGDEFVELYNPTGAAVNIGLWYIRRSSSCASSLATFMTIPSGTVLKPGQHYLAAASDANNPDGSSINEPDQTFSPGIADDGGLALVSSGGVTIDAAGMCSTTYFREGNTLAPLTGNSNQSYERKPGGETACYDTNDNASDFAWRSPANPQDSKSAAVMCSGVNLYTPTKTPTLTPTRTSTPRPTAVPGNVVINEFLPHPHTDWNSDGVANIEDEYIEIINLGSSAINVINWRIDTGAGSKAFYLPDLLLQPRQITAFFRTQTGLALSDGGATVRLVKPDGNIIDAYTYPTVEAIDQNWCRFPDGTGVWGFACRPTPNRPNALVIISAPIPGSLPAAAVPSICKSLNEIPQAMILAECGSFGAGISTNLEQKLFWLPGNLKWAVFIE